MGSNDYILPMLLLVTWVIYVKMEDVYDKLEWRLPTILRPAKYKIHLNITQEALTGINNDYTGMVIIDLMATEPTSEIKLHVSNNYLDLHLITVNDTEIDNSNYSISNFTDILTISLPNDLPSNETTIITLWFSGRISKKELRGFYRSKYFTGEGEPKYLVTTQFQSVFARRAFPCFDEPFFKASFEIYLTYPLGYNALSNAPGEIDKRDRVSETMHFEPTPIMSTYILAFIVSEFNCNEGSPTGGVPHRVCSRSDTKELKNRSQWALEIAPKIMSYLIDYTQLNYSAYMPKLDQVAIPDFEAAAMENWGLVTYREELLLWDSETSTLSAKRYIAQIMAHEFSHVWFGNLVTCSWWSVLYVNEGLAFLLEYLTIAAVEPSWELDKVYVVEVLQKTLGEDVKMSKSPLQSPVNTPDEAEDKFDIISYEKGSTIYNMLMNFMGVEGFRNSLRIFLKEFQYGIVTPDDVWTALQAGMDNESITLPAANLSEVMYNWTHCRGYPLITVDFHGQNVTLRQKNFILAEDTKWYIPLCFTTSKDEEGKSKCAGSYIWLTPKEDLTLTFEGEVKWFIIKDYLGYFRVDYGLNGWRRIKYVLQRENFSGLSDIHRSQIINDLFSFGEFGKYPYSRIFDTIQFLKNDTSYFPWLSATKNFFLLLNKVGRRTKLGAAMSSHFSMLMKNLFRDVIARSEDGTVPSLKETLTVTAACIFGKRACVEASKSMLYDYIFTGATPHKKIRQTIFCTGLRYSDDFNEWLFLWKTFQNTTLPSERNLLISALGCTEDKVLLERYLKASINKNISILVQERPSIFVAVCKGSSVGLESAFQFFKEHIDSIMEMYGSRTSMLKIITEMASRFTRENQMVEFEQFLRDKAIHATYGQWALEAMESARMSIEWLRHRKPDLERYFLAEEEASGATEAFNIRICTILLAFGLLYEDL